MGEGLGEELVVYNKKVNRIELRDHEIIAKPIIFICPSFSPIVTQSRIKEKSSKILNLENAPQVRGLVSILIIFHLASIIETKSDILLADVMFKSSNFFSTEITKRIFKLHFKLVAVHFKCRGYFPLLPVKK
uniref:Uncharacterized protein n=1 Tax=Rhizophagus irregularis (strain DAOM 181602 / DAOM 197198 / MUCL 43194) TaxID=747089 RepID=U9TC19_RHIID